MGGMPGLSGVGRSDLLGGDGGDVNYPYYLINGRIPAAPRHSQQNRDSASASASSTQPPIQRSGSHWPGTA